MAGGILAGPEAPENHPSLDDSVRAPNETRGPLLSRDAVRAPRRLSRGNKIIIKKEKQEQVASTCPIIITQRVNSRDKKTAGKLRFPRRDLGSFGGLLWRGGGGSRLRRSQLTHHLFTSFIPSSHLPSDGKRLFSPGNPPEPVA